MFYGKTIRVVEEEAGDSDWLHPPKVQVRTSMPLLFNEKKTRILISD